VAGGENVVVYGAWAASAGFCKIFTRVSCLWSGLRRDMRKISKMMGEMMGEEMGEEMASDQQPLTRPARYNDRHQPFYLLLSYNLCR
jgi:hypothetical protein